MLYPGEYISGLVILKLIMKRDHCIVGVMVRMLASSVVDRGFESQSGQTKDYEMGICCF